MKKTPDLGKLSSDMRLSEDKTFLFLLVAVSIAFVWIVWQFYGAVLWAVVIAVLFSPLNRQLVNVRGMGRTLAALASVAIIMFMVIVPLGFLTAALLIEASTVFDSIRSGEFEVGPFIEKLVDAMPPWVTSVLDWLGLANVMAVQQRLSNVVGGAGHFLAARLLNIGQGTAAFFVNLFIMLYLLFFLFRDGSEYVRLIKQAIPLQPEQKSAIAEEFTLVIRATVKGNIIVAIVQGALGGVMFWILGIHAALLWGSLMALLSLLPAVGSALIWLPVATYLFLTGAVWQGIVLIAYGAIVIGLVDNFLRPILVGRDTQMPDYVVLIATLGGIIIFGVNGFVLGPLIAAMFITLWNIFFRSADKQASQPHGS